MKILELAKKLKIPAKVLLIQVIKAGIKAKTPSDSLTDEALDKVLKAVSSKKPQAELEAIKKSIAQDKEKKAQKKPAIKEKPKAKKVSTKEKPAKEKPAPAKKPQAKKEAKPAVYEKEKILPEIEKPKPALTRPAATIQKPTVAVQKPAVQPQAVKIEIKEEVKPPPVKTMQVKFPIMVKDLAEKVSVGPGVIIKSLMDMKVLATINQLIGEDDAKAVAEKFGYKLERLPTLEEEIIAKHQEQDDKKEDLLPRPPVVTIMGHVDHGKTSLLDYIRKAKVADQEKGGITQHIGAYEVDLRKGKITFLDTPGHEAFTAMRARGANATDLVVLVVAADDGVMPQTVEALDHARAADVPILVAITKVDKQNIDLDRVKKQLADLNLLPEDWGGKTVTVNVSAKTGEGVDNLLEMILLEAELLELKANPNKPARGVVVEAKLSKGGGPIATVLVQGGTLRQGDIVVCGQHYGKVRALINDKIHRVPHAPPSIPVEILGLNGVPQAGDTFMVVEDDKRAKEICSIREQKIKEEQAQPTARRITLEDLYSEIQKGKLKELNVIIKTDVRGSLEAMADSLMKLSSQAIGLNIIHKGVGDINESDILLAAASNAIVIGFNVQKTPEADPAAKLQQVDVRTYGIIYEAVSDIKAAMEGMLEPQIKEIFIGRVVIKQVFKVSKSGIIAGSYVQKGKITRNTNCRLVRDGQQVYKGKISSLKRFKDDVREVAEGFECGIALENFEDIKAGDIIEAFGIEKIARKL